MSNKQVFTTYDVYGFKKALALHAAKNNALQQKWLSALNSLKKDIEELYTFVPGNDRDYRLRDKQNSLYYVEEFLKDIATPCDLFISNFEECEVVNG